MYNLPPHPPLLLTHPQVHHTNPLADLPHNPRLRRLQPLQLRLQLPPPPTPAPKSTPTSRSPPTTALRLPRPTAHPSPRLPRKHHPGLANPVRNDTVHAGERLQATRAAAAAAALAEHTPAAELRARGGGAGAGAEGGGEDAGAEEGV